MEIKRERLVVQASFQKDFFSACDLRYLNPDPWVLDWVFTFDGELDAPGSIEPGANAGFLRPPRHRRATYYSPIHVDTWAETSLVCIKGMEPGCADLCDWFHRLLSEGPSGTGFRLLEHFPLVEGKPPLALTKGEALGDAEIALEIHGAFSNAGLKMPPIPFPIAVLRHPSSVKGDYLEALKDVANPIVFKRVSDLISEGLYCYIYFYPYPSQRVADVLPSLPTNSYERRAQVLEADFDAGSTIDRWIGLLSNLLGLGYVAASRYDRFSGSCFDINNAVIGGGVCDMGSCKLFAYFKTDHDLFEAINISIRVLTRTIHTFLLGALGSFRAEEYTQDVVSQRMRETISNRLMNAPFKVHPKAVEFFQAPSTSYPNYFRGYFP